MAHEFHHVVRWRGPGPPRTLLKTRVFGRQYLTSQVVAVSLKLLRRQSPGLKLVVSFADLCQGTAA